MKRINFKIKVFATILLLVIFASSDILAQRGQRFDRNQNNNGARLHQNMPQGRMANQDLGSRGGMFGLDLTEDQVKQMNELRTKNLKEMLPIRNEMQEKRAHLRTLTTAENVNDKELNQTIDELTVLISKQMKMRVAHHQEIRSMLTDDQRVIFDSRSGRMGNRQFSKGNRRGGGRAMSFGPGFRAR